jgi:hypothetical protein
LFLATSKTLAKQRLRSQLSSGTRYFQNIHSEAIETSFFLSLLLDRHFGAGKEEAAINRL